MYGLKFLLMVFIIINIKSFTFKRQIATPPVYNRKKFFFFIPPRVSVTETCKHQRFENKS